MNRGGGGLTKLPSGFASVISALADDVTINLDSEHNNIALKPVEGDNSMLNATVGMALDAARIMYSLYLEYLDIGELRNGEIGSPSMIKLNAFLNPENYSALYDRGDERNDFKKTFQKNMQPLIIETVINVLNKHSDGAITAVSLIDFAETYGRRNSWNGVAARKALLGQFYKPLFGFDSGEPPVFDHNTANKLKDIVLECISDLWKKLANNVLIGAPQDAVIDEVITKILTVYDQYNGSLYDMMSRAFGNGTGGSGLCFSLADASYQPLYSPIRDILVSPGIDGNAGETWLITDDSLMKLSNESLINSIDTYSNTFGQDHPQPAIVVDFLTDVTIESATIAGQDIIINAYWTEADAISGAVSTAWGVLRVPLSTESLITDLPNVTVLKSTSRLMPVKGTPRSQHASIDINPLAKFPIRCIGNVNREIFIDYSKLPEFSASYPTDFYSSSLLPDENNYLISVRDFEGKKNLFIGGDINIKDWWGVDKVYFNLRIAFHASLNVVGAINDQLIISYYNQTDYRQYWAFLPLRTFMPAQWGENNTELFMNLLATKMYDDAPMIAGVGDPANSGIATALEEATNASMSDQMLSFEEGNVSDIFSDDSKTISLSSSSDRSVRFYECFTDGFPNLTRKIFMENGYGFNQVSHEVVGKHLLVTTINSNCIEHQLTQIQ